jgi:hypothetical protein
MKKFPVGEKSPQQKNPRALNEARPPPQGGQQEHEVQQDECVRDFHGVKAYPSMGDLALRRLAERIQTMLATPFMPKAFIGASKTRSRQPSP